MAMAFIRQYQPSDFEATAHIVSPQRWPNWLETSAQPPAATGPLDHLNSSFTDDLTLI